MISFPIIFREFRYSARKKRTFVMRVIFGALLGLMVLMFVLGHFATESQAMGRYLLVTYGWQMFVLVFVLGPALTCGCISDERRDGTLPLLFLTHMNSADIVLGKFIGKGFDAFMLLLVTMPFLFVPVLLGGVDWDTTVALVILLVSQLGLGVAVGIVASSLLRGTVGSFTFAYIALGFFNVVCALIFPVAKLADFLFLQVGNRSLDLAQDWFVWIGRLAPLHGLIRLSSISPGESLFTLGFCSIVSLLLLWLATWRLPRSLKEKEESRAPAVGSRVAHTGSPRLPRPCSRWWMERSPMLWLTYGRRKKAVWLEIAFVAGVCALAWYLEAPGGLLIVGGYLLWMAIKLIFVVDVARSFATEKENGSIAMLLTTPFSNTQIVNGQLYGAFARYGVLTLSAIGFALVGGLSHEWNVASLIVPALMVSELACVLCLTLLISAMAKTVTQAITISVAATLFVSTFLKAGFGICLFGVVTEPVVALVSYLILASNIRHYLAR